MTTEPAAYCGHGDCVQAVNEWTVAGHPNVTYEHVGPVRTHRSEVLFYARRDWLANGYETAAADGSPYTDEQRSAYAMRDRERLHRAAAREARRRRAAA